MKAYQKRIIAAVVVIALLAAGLLGIYILESRFFLLGKTLYPLYVSLNQIHQNRVNPEAEQQDTIVYCDYYTWHDGQNWERGYSNQPLLGFYHSLDEQVISKHLEWAQNFGIDVFKIEYLPQFDHTIAEGIFDYDMGQTKLCFMYDSRLRFESIGYKYPPYDFGQKEIAGTFLEDLNHIADTYFASENYFKIEGKPVLWIYVSRDFTGPYQQVIAEARENLAQKGYQVYLVGDAVFWNYRLEQVKVFDAVSCYTAYAGRPQNTAEFAERLKFLYMVWKIAASAADTDFIPSAIPAYDDRCLSSERQSVPPLEGTADDFKYQLETIKAFLDPVNISTGLTQVSIATFNEHQEGSSVEPSLEWGYERIEQIPAVFGLD